MDRDVRQGPLNRVRQLLEMIRFSHTLFALPFALLAGVMAWTARGPAGETISFQWLHLLGILVCMVGARSAAMAFNRLVDRELDAENPRTATRHLPRREIPLTTVVGFIALSSLMFISGTLLFLPNPLPLMLSIPVLLVVLGYSYSKRFTFLAHFWLGFALMLAPVSVWIALRGLEVMANPWDLAPALVLGFAVKLWVAGFDIIYACQDVEFDRQAELRSVPARLGVRGALRIAAACHLLMIVVLAWLPWVSTWSGATLGLGWLYWLGLLATAALLIYEHWLVRPDDLTRVNVAFFNVNAVVSFGLFAVTSVDLLWF